MGYEVLQCDGLPEYLTDYTFNDEYRVPIMTIPPTMDGLVREEEWKLAVGFDGMSYSGNLDERRARVYIGATKTHFYFAVISEMPPDGKLATTITTHSAEKIVWDDSIEVWIEPDPGKESGIVHQMVTNASGIEAYQSTARGHVKPEEAYGWKGNYQIVNGFHEGYWHCQIAVPVERLAQNRLTTDGRWGINLCRDFKNPWGFASLGNHGFNPLDELVFTFTESGSTAIHCRQESDPTTRDIHTVISIFNPNPTPITISTQIFLKRDLMPEVTENSIDTIAGGATKEVTLQVKDGVSNKFSLYTIIREPDGPFHYTRYFTWGPPRENRWIMHDAEAHPIDFRFAYYPYSNHMRIKAEIGQLADNTTLSSLNFTIREKNGTIIKTLTMDIAQLPNATEVAFDLPALSGEYEIIAEVCGHNVPDEVIVKSFERTIYEWEHQRLGTSRTVFAPFTPITVTGNTLHTVMKSYDMNEIGLLNQVCTTDQQGFTTEDILARPMTYRAVVDGQQVTPQEAQFLITETADDIVIGNSSAHLGNLTLQTKSTLEYDGMLRIDLTLSAVATTHVEKLDLEIPIRQDTARMMHAMIDALRYPIFTASVPEGEGVVWTAANLQPNDFPANFCTYIFLGNALRGLCWFAENDKGWSWNSEQPNLELVRQGNEVLLRVHLVNKPLLLDSPRTITFGLQAAPVKPRLEGWRYKWHTDNYTVLGCDRHWLALGCCCSFYPAGKELALWRALQHSNITPLSEADVTQVLDLGRPYFEAHGKAAVEEFETYARQSLQKRAHTTRIFYYNRSSTPVDPEFHTFVDEWCLGDYNDKMRQQHHRGEVKVTPSPSYIDFVLYWYGKSFDCGGNTGVYIDNNFFAGDYNREMTNAYLKDDGTIMPSTGVWGLRELAKRTFVYLNERGMLPINMVHTTSTEILPVNSFYTVQYDWEWHFSEGDVHNRFSKEYLLQVSNCEHLGAWPIVLHEQGKSVEDLWTLKTFLAVCIVHEILIDPYVWDHYPVPAGDNVENRLFVTFRQPLIDIAQQPDVEVYRYWGRQNATGASFK